MAQNTQKSRAKNNDAAGIDGLRDLLILKVKALYDVESEFAALSEAMAEKASDAELKECFEDQAEQAGMQAERMLGAFEALELKPQKSPDTVIRSLATDVAWLVKNVKRPETLDVGLIAAARAALHYQIACAAALMGWAKLLEEDDVADILEETLDENEEADEELADLAESTVDEAALPDEDSEEEEEEEADE